MTSHVKAQCMCTYEGRRTHTRRLHKPVPVEPCERNVFSTWTIGILFDQPAKFGQANRSQYKNNAKPQGKKSKAKARTGWGKQQKRAKTERQICDEQGSTATAELQTHEMHYFSTCIDENNYMNLSIV